jgi:hypothetical protein
MSMRTTLCSLFLLLVVVQHAARAQRGADIYHKGVTSAGQVAIGNSDGSRKLNKAPSSLFACGNCHGELAQGRAESGVIAPAISWQQLSQTWRSKADLISPRKAYDLEAFANVLRNGIDSNGANISGVMPRYTLNDAELNSLAEYLAEVAVVNTAGVDDSTITIEMVFPDDPKLAEMLRRTTQAHFERLNQQGGIYGRSLMFFEPSKHEQVPFCVLDLSMQPSISHPISEIVLAIFSSQPSAENHFALYQHPLIDNASQQRSLLQAVDRQGLQAISVAESGLEKALQKFAQMSKSERLSSVLIHQQSEIDLSSLLKRLSALNQAVNIITDRAAIAASGLPLLTPYKGKIYLASPPGLDWVSTGGGRQLLEMAAERTDSNMVPREFSENLSSRVWALALQKLLITALQQGGRDLTTATFLQALQSQVDLQTDLTPPISYSAIRRVGSDVVDLQRVH